MKSSKVTAKPRYQLLDELRGFAVFCMIFYHGFFTAGYEWDLPLFRAFMDFFAPAEPFFAAFFILLSGVACQLSRSNLKRGFKLLMISLALTGITLLLPRFGFTECEILFGILHLLSFGMLLVALCNPLIKKCPPLIFALFMLALFFFTFPAETGYFGFGSLKIALPQALYDTNRWFILGFHNAEFFSADYFPLLPWIFMFLAGAFLGLYEARGKFPAFFLKRRVPFFGFLGRHALLIYLLHQPVIYLIIFAADYLVRLF